MTDRDLEQLSRMVAEAAALEEASHAAAPHAGCLSMSRLAAFADRLGAPAAGEARHLRGCAICAARLRALTGAAVPERRWRRIILFQAASLALTAAAACLALWLVPHRHAAPPPHRPVHMVHAGGSALHGDAAKFVDLSCMICDANCDGVVNFLDLDAFLLALGSPGQYAADFPRCDLVCRNDANCDGKVNVADIEPFEVCLMGR